MAALLKLALQDYAYSLGFDLLGVTDANRPDDYGRYLQWVAQGHGADMHYMTEARRREKRGDLHLILPGVESVIIGAVNYKPSQHAHPSDIHFARYAWGQDYHQVILHKLEKLEQWLHSQSPSPIQTRSYVDTGPILERSLAQRAGLGWIGKNTCLINRGRGSYLYLGEILTTLSLPSDRPTSSHCGTCTRCLDACPTDAFVGPHQLNAEKCLSYQTLENRAPQLPSSLGQQQGAWVAGCDICQEVCPWNRKSPATHLPELQPGPHVLLTARTVLDNPQQTTEALKGTALQRLGAQRLRRNVQSAQILKGQDG